MNLSLSESLLQMNIDFSDDQLQSLTSFIELLHKWNKVYNLTAIRDKNEMVNTHLLDSLSILPFLNPAQRILDVGSGAGLPGIPLAIFLPQKQFVLLDSNVKKTRFIQQAIVELRIRNVQVVHSRVEKYHPNELFDCITTRAFATIANTLELVDHLLEKHGKLLFMKSNTAEAELEQAKFAYNHELIDLFVPGIDANRCLVVLSR